FALAAAAVVVAAENARAVFPSLGGEDAPPPASQGKTVWVCPPCHDDHDKTEYDKPGSCPVCGMPLIDKSQIAKEEARMAAAMQASQARKKAAILVFPGVQIIDFTGPYEVLGQAGLDVYTVSEEKGPFATNGGMTITPSYTLADA